MKCLMKYEWVKLMRCHLPQGKGIMGAYTCLASRAAFRKGQAEYCGYTNEVNAGERSGGIVGVKSIMTLTKEQQKLVEDNLGLGKAPMKDKGGCFSPFAYRLIWNEICDALAYATKRAATTDLTGSHILSCNSFILDSVRIFLSNPQ